jgi:hypothetical protein
VALSRSIKIGFAGALFSALLGPLLGALVTASAGAIATRQISALLATAFYFFVAVVMFGPGALPAGFLVGYLAHRWAREGTSAAKVIIKSTGTGAVAGAIAAALSWLVVSSGRTDANSVALISALGMGGGAVTGALFSWLVVRAQRRLTRADSAASSA